MTESQNSSNILMVSINESESGNTMQNNLSESDKTDNTKAVIDLDDVMKDQLVGEIKKKTEAYKLCKSVVSDDMVGSLLEMLC